MLPMRQESPTYQSFYGLIRVKTTNPPFPLQNILTQKTCSCHNVTCFLVKIDALGLHTKCIYIMDAGYVAYGLVVTWIYVFRTPALVKSGGKG